MLLLSNIAGIAMSLINWKTDVTVSYLDEDDKEQALLLMLTRNQSEIEQWTGEVTSQKILGKKNSTRVKVRKQLQGTNILIDIGLKDMHQSPTNRLSVRTVNSSSLICLSANGKMNYTIDELNLVIREAYSVYQSMINKKGN